MTSRTIQAWLGVMLVTASAAVFAQGVYVIQTDKGPVFSDKPQAGAKEVTLRPLSVVPSVKETKPIEAPPPVASRESPSRPREDSGRGDAAPAYSSLAIVEPADNGSVVANTGVFEVRLAIDPPLRLGEGHAFVVRINGRTVAQRFTATEFLIPAEFWAENPPPANQMAQLDVAVVDGGGQVLRRASPVRFMMRYVTVLNQPRPTVLSPIAPHHFPARPKLKPELPKSEPVKPQASPSNSASGLVGRKDP